MEQTRFTGNQYPDPVTGSSLRKTDVEFSDKNGNKNRCYETLIKVVIDENTYFMQTPVMNGSNPVKDNSMTQQRVWNSMCRAFVKCVAIHTGLGFDLWLKEENHNEPFIPETLKKRASAAKSKQSSRYVQVTVSMETLGLLETERLGKN